METSIKRPVGRPKKTPDSSEHKTIYTITNAVTPDQAAIEARIVSECVFVVVSTKIDMSAEAILREYKMQSAVERKFQFIKSLQFVNSLYVDSPR